METSKEIGKISEALAKAQGQIKPAAFDAMNPHFKSRYATLTSIMESCRPALSAEGIALVQGTSVEENRVLVTTMLLHSSGEWIRDSLAIKLVKEDAQGIGSAITYARRYSLASLVGVVSDDDDDGEKAVGRSDQKPKLTAVKKNQIPTPSGTDGNSPQMSQPSTDSRPPLSTTKLETVSNSAKPEPKIESRVAKIRKIFETSAQIGHSPQEMKAEIGKILGLDHPLRDSNEMTDSDLDKVLEVLTRTLSEKLEAQKGAAA